MKEIKYKLTDKYITHHGRKLFQIMAIKDFLNGDFKIKKGDLGGYIESYKNLSDNAWVYDNAKVYGKAKVFGNASVMHESEVLGKSKVFENAEVSGDSILINVNGLTTKYKNTCIEIVLDEINELAKNNRITPDDVSWKSIAMSLSSKLSKEKKQKSIHYLLLIISVIIVSILTNIFFL